jgi:ribonuclease J
VLYLCTGSQGEPNAALARVARGDHPSVKLGADDTVIFSSRVIPGNERAIGEIQNMLAERNIKLVTDKQFDIHVSGHPCRDELRRMYLWAKPRIAVPVHGERRHIMEHARYARSLQVPEAITPDNGDVIRLAPGPVMVIDQVPVGRLHVDGEVLTSDKAGGMWERRKMAYNGHLTVSIVIAKGKIEDGPTYCRARLFGARWAAGGRVARAARRSGGRGARVWHEAQLISATTTRSRRF